MTKRKRISALLLALLMVLCLLPISALAADDDATLTSGTLADVTISGDFSGGADIASGTDLTVTIPDGSRTNASMVLTTGDAGAAVSYVLSGSQPADDAAYTDTYTAGSTTVTVADGDILWLLVNAADGTTKLYYKLTVTVSDASNDATLTSSIGTVDNTAETITDIPYGTTLTDFKVAITPAAGANFEVYEADGTTTASDLSSGYKVIVTAEDTITTKTYTVTVSDASNDATLMSSIGTVDSTAETITDIAYGTTLTVFKAAITPASGASFEVYEADGTTTASDLATDYKVIVTAQDGTTTKTYTVTVSDAVLCSAEITIGLSYGSNELINLTFTDTSGDPVTSTMVTAENTNTYTISVAAGTYHYEAVSADGSTGYGSGSFTVAEDGQEIWLRQVHFGKMTENITQGFDMTMTSADKTVEFSHGDEDVSFVVPALDGDGYYYYSLIPDDTVNYVRYTGHVYVYYHTGCLKFSGINSSDDNTLEIVENNPITVKAPKGMDVCWVSQLKFYMARDYTALTYLFSDDTYDYYSMNYPVSAGKNDSFMLRQDLKVTRYGLAEAVGTWNADETVLTLRELLDDPYQINRDQGYYEAGFMCNLPHSKQLSLQTGEYFDLVALRGWQAVENVSGNSHQDPEFHYTVIGDSVVVEVAEDDEIGQFGRIRAVQPGVSVVVFTYDAMEYYAADYSMRDEYGLLCYSALWPENTGVAVVKVDENGNTDINTNIALYEYDTIYFTKTMTDATGVTEQVDSYAEYTFTPDAAGDISVRVHDPYMVENGQLNITDETDWTTSAYWTSYAANGDGSYTVQLKEGRNIIEVAAGDSVEYHVVMAKGLDITITNESAPGQPLTTGCDAQVQFDGMLTPIYKYGAVYNPQGYTLIYDMDGAELSVPLGQYSVSTNAIIQLYLDEEGVISFSDGHLRSVLYTLDVTTHRTLTRCSRVSIYDGGDTGTVDVNQICVLPDFTLEVQDAGELEEAEKRNAGLLSYLAVPFHSLTATSTEAIPQSNFVIVPMAGGTTPLTVTATPADADWGENDTILVRCWKHGEDPADAVVKEIEAGVETTLEAAGYLNRAAVYLEVIVVPEDGYPMTYGCYLRHMMAATTPMIMESFSLFPAEGSDLFGRFEGILEADSVTVTLNDEEKTLDFGYGYFGTEFSYTTQVPYGTEEIVYNTEDTSVTAIIAGDTSVTYEDGDAIPLSVGENTLEVTRSTTSTLTYTIVITRTEQPKSVTLDGVPDGAEVTVKKSSGRTVTAETDGSYALQPGTYTYIIVLDGYITKVEEFTVTSDMTQTVTVGAMEAVPAQDGSVTVTVVGYDGIVRSTTTVSIDEEPADLDGLNYVLYNNGGYTALHAIIDAFELGMFNVEFSCREGIIVPDNNMDTTGHGENAGWVCEVNGTVAESQSTIVYDGDTIVYYYNADYDGMRHASFASSTAAGKEGEPVSLQLVSTEIPNDGSAAVPVADATIFVNGVQAGATDENGEVTIAGTSFETAGVYVVTAEKLNGNNENTLTYALCTITIKVGDFVEIEGQTAVTFRLIGDSKHGDFDSHESYVTWIATRTYTFSSDEVSVYDVFTYALNQAGLAYTGADDNYVNAIQAPTAYGGYWLSELDNGENSGWMYTVNGLHSQVGLQDYYVSTGDVIIWHYVDDYLLETYFDGNTPTYPNRWLEAADEDPPSDGTVINMDQTEDTAAGETTILTPEVTVTDGKASASVSKDDIDAIIEAADESGTTTVTISATTTETVTKSTVTLPSGSASDMADAGLSLTVETSNGMFDIDNAALSAIGGTGSGEIVVSVEQLDTDDLTDANKELVGDHPVFDLSITVGGTKVTDFGNGTVTVSLPYVPADGEDTDKLTVYYIDDDGNAVEMEGTYYDASNGCVIFETNHFSTFAIVYDESVSFNDVAETDWFYEAVMYAVQNGLFSGTSSTTFDPNDDMTRAMLVTVLYRLEGEPEITGSNAFDDVIDGQWYTDAVIWASENEIASGYGGGLFGTSDSVTREQMATILYNYAVHKGYDMTAAADLTAYNDASDISSWAEAAMGWANGMGLITGVTDTTLDPSGSATRAQVATILMRFVQSVVGHS